MCMCVGITCKGAYTLQLCAQQCCRTGCALCGHQQQLRVVRSLYDRVPEDTQQGTRITVTSDHNHKPDSRPFSIFLMQLQGTYWALGM